MSPNPIQVVYSCPRDGKITLPRTRYDGTLPSCPKCGFYPIVQCRPVPTFAEFVEAEVVA